MRALALLLALLTLGALAPAEAQQGRRVALVVGIDDYREVDKLTRARNDAQAVGARLRELGFEVILRSDPDRRALALAMGEFEEKLRGAEVGLFFFAGHGVEIRGANVLLPADLPASLTESVILREGLILADVAQAMSDSGVRFSVLIIDACRDNPLPRQAGRSIGRTRGLGRAEVPRGTYVVYSAGIGEAALDRLSDEDASPNSVFTRHLLPALGKPGLSLDQQIKQVRERVREEALTVRHQQNPAIYDQATGELFLNATPAPNQGSPPGAAAPQAGAPAAAPDATQAEMLFWQSISGSSRPAEFEAYLSRWPEGVFAPLARARLAALAPAARPATPPAPAPPPSREAIAEAQRALGALGLDPGPADGMAGPRSRAALRAYQRATGEAVDGELDEALQQRLRQDPPAAADLARGLAQEAEAARGAGQRAEALRLLDAAARLQPADPALALAQGDAQREAGQIDAARRSYERARRADPAAPAAREAEQRLAALAAAPRAVPAAVPGAVAAPAPGRGCGVSFAGTRSQDGLVGYAFANSCPTAMAFRANCQGNPNVGRSELLVQPRATTVVWAGRGAASGGCAVVSAQAR